jgi:hypothetical protein
LTPSAEELLALARKYDTLAKLRRARSRGEGVADRATLRALSREFPGALRELDTVSLAEIDRRKRALDAAARGLGVETWMTWMAAYHTTMRAALVVKARVLRSKKLSDELVGTLRKDVLRRIGLEIEETFVRKVAHPPEGRLNRVVFERLGQKFGVPADEIWDALFPARRAGRY